MMIDGTHAVNNVLVKAYDGYSPPIKQTLIDGENILQVADMESIINTYNEYFETYIYTIAVVLIMAVLIAFAIIYNISGVSLSERQRELATMRVLGYSVPETTEILSFENYVLCFLAIIIGIPITILTARAMGAAMDNDIFTMPDSLPAVSYVYSGLCCMLSVFLSNLAIRKNVRRFSLVEVLKERE
jgi:putative ABC transport system permease protein